LKFPDASGRIEHAALLGGFLLVLVLFATLPDESSGRVLVSAGFSGAAVAFAGFSLAVAVRRSRESELGFWALLGAGLAVYVAGNVLLSGAGTRDTLFTGLTLHSITQAIAYLLMLGALAWLLRIVRGRVTLVVALDVVSVMLMSGTLLWYFVLSGSVVAGGWLEAAAVVFELVSYVGLLLLGLGVLLLVRRPAFVLPLVAGFYLFLVAEAMYQALYPEHLYRAGSWSEVVWSAGLLCVGLAALRAGAVERLEYPAFRVRDVVLFWLSPLSPLLQLALLLAWGVLYPPLPAYVLGAGAVLAVLLAVRIAVNSYVYRHLAQARERLDRGAERRRIALELHDSLKQELTGSSLSLVAALRQLERGDETAARKAVEEALEGSRESLREVRAIVEELRPVHLEREFGLQKLLEQLAGDTQERFGMGVVLDLRGSWTALAAAERAVVYRIVSEAVWNAARHSGAERVLVRSRNLGEAGVLVEVRDEGCGFRPDGRSTGHGLSIMRSRAEEAGAELEVHSAPGEGTTVSLRFGGP
jgi:signal transduction histidine kinase